MSSEKISKSEDFSKNYEKLKRSIEDLNMASDGDLDTIIKSTTEGLEAHKNCTERLQEIKKMLEDKFK